jgi:peptide/nickel transport system substrate-binding protein
MSSEKIYLLVLSILSAFGCVQDADIGEFDEAQTIRFATYAPVHKFDPHLTDGGVSFSSYNILVYDGLLIGNPESLWRPLPNLAIEWDWITDTTIEFKLRENVTFSDGASFDACVAKANLDRMLALRGPRFRTVSSIKNVEVIDDFTLRIHLHQYDPAMLRALTGPPGSMVSPAAFDNEDLDLNPVGSGPWLYDKDNSTIGEVHRFIPRPGYHMFANPSLANIEVYQIKDSRARLNALISGEIDVTILRPVEAKAAEDLGFAISTRENRWFGLTILDRNGELVPELADVRVRQAIGFAVDRQAIADSIYFGYARPASQPMVEEYGYVPELDNFYRYDPEYARQLLNEAGVDEFTFVAPVLPDSQPQYEAVQHYLRKVGINMEIEIIESTQHGALSRTTLYPVNTHTSPSFDPDNRHRAIWGSDAVFNPFRVTTEHTDRLADEAIASSIEELRYRNYAEYFDFVVKEGRTIIYLQVDDIVAYNPNKLSDVQVSGFIDPILRYIRLASDDND